MLKKIYSGEIHIYCINYKHFYQYIDDMQKDLTAAEFIRANKFKFNNDRSRFIIGRSWLKKLFGSYLLIESSEIEFNLNQFGKPYLAKQSYEKINFNLSDTGDFIIYAFCLNDEVGIDIEKIDTLMNHLEIAENYFTADEVCYLKSSLDQDQLAERFFRIWTRKEAILKAVGIGLLPDLTKVDTLNNKININDLSTKSIDNCNSEWIIADLNIVNNYKAAIAYSGSPKSLIIEWIR